MNTQNHLVRFQNVLDQRNNRTGKTKSIKSVAKSAIGRLNSEDFSRSLLSPTSLFCHHYFESETGPILSTQLANGPQFDHVGPVEGAAEVFIQLSSSMHPVPVLTPSPTYPVLHVHERPEGKILAQTALTSQSLVVREQRSSGTQAFGDGSYRNNEGSQQTVPFKKDRHNIDSMEGLNCTLNFQSLKT